MRILHCLPTRVLALLSAQNRRTADLDLSAMVEDACACPSRETCMLGSACHSIHHSFLPARPGIA